jgi:hypothetical protein
MRRTIRAFFKALQMTIRGETIAPSHYQPLNVWIDGGLQTLAIVFTTADANDLPQEKRQQIQLKLDGHMTSLEQTLQMVRHNWVNEYPKLIQLDDPYTMMVIQSSNMNDQYRVSQFATADEIPSSEVKQALERLNAHLMNLPTIERPDHVTST